MLILAGSNPASLTSFSHMNNTNLIVSVTAQDISNKSECPVFAAIRRATPKTCTLRVLEKEAILGSEFAYLPATARAAVMLFDQRQSSKIKPFTFSLHFKL